MSHWIRAEKDTWLKKSTAPADKLEADQKRKVAAGTHYPVDGYEELKNFHFLVQLEDGDWIIFDNGTEGQWSHWVLSWEEDTEEKEPTPPAAIVSAVPTTSATGPNLTPGMPFSTRITPHITYGEFALYQEARRFDYQHQCQNSL